VRASLLETTPELWEKLLRINLFGQIAVAHAFARGMAERGHGVIVNVSSDAGKVGSTGETVYAAAKGGVIIGICDELKIPVRYVGVGEKVVDLKPFDPHEFVEALFS